MKLPRTLLMRLLTRHQNILLTRVKPKYFKWLGGGLYADVWRISARRVLKLTKDKTDVKALLYMNKLKMPWVPRVYDAFSIGANHFVVAEYCPRSVHWPSWDPVLCRSAQGHRSRTALAWVADINAWFAANGIRWVDRHSGNVRYTRGRKPVIVDCGRMYGGQIQKTVVPALSA